MEKKVLICCNAYPPNFIGGAELIAHSQAKQLQNLGYKVLIFTGDTREYGQRHSIRKENYDGLPVYRIYLTNEDYDPHFINFAHRDIESLFKKTLSEFSPDVVHFHNIIGLSVGLIRIAKARGFKTVMTLHDHWGFCHKNTRIKDDEKICEDISTCDECMRVIHDTNFRNIPIRMRQDFIADQLENIDTFISPSQYLADAYIQAGIPREKIQVVWNGVDVAYFSKILKKDGEGKIRFTFIGYHGRHKGIHVLLESLKYIDEIQKVEINLVGSGEPLFTQYKNEISRGRYKDTGTFLGENQRYPESIPEYGCFHFTIDLAGKSAGIYY